MSNDSRAESRTSKRCFDFLSGMCVGVSSEETQGELKQMLRIKYLNFCCLQKSKLSSSATEWQSCPIPIFFKRLRRQSLPSDCPLTRWQSRNSGTKPAKAENCDSAIAINAIVVAMQSGQKDATNARLALARGATLVPADFPLKPDVTGSWLMTGSTMHIAFG